MDNLSFSENETIIETMSHHTLSKEQKDEAWRLIRKRAEAPSFNAYNVTHQVCALITHRVERKKRARITKHEGDDKYSWALFIEGRVAYNGMDRNEATWRRDRYIKDDIL